MNFIKEKYANQFTKGLMIFVRVLLILSISSLIIGCLLMLVFGLDNSIAYGIMWVSVMCSAFIYYFSILVLIGVTVDYKIKNEKAWEIIKKETILLGISILCFLTLGLVNNYM